MLKKVNFFKSEHETTSLNKKPNLTVQCRYNIRKSWGNKLYNMKIRYRKKT